MNLVPYTAPHLGETGTFFYSKMIANYQNAEEHCRDLKSSHLAVIKDQDVFNEFKKGIPKEGPPKDYRHEYWRIGASKSKKTQFEFKWIDGSSYNNDGVFEVTPLPTSSSSSCRSVVYHFDKLKHTDTFYTINCEEKNFR